MSNLVGETVTLWIMNGTTAVATGVVRAVGAGCESLLVEVTNDLNGTYAKGSIARWFTGSAGERIMVGTPP